MVKTRDGSAQRLGNCQEPDRVDGMLPFNNAIDVHRFKAMGHPYTRPKLQQIAVLFYNK